MTISPPANTSGSCDSESPTGLRAAVRNITFGKKLRWPELGVPHRRERLRIIGAQLNLLFAYRIESGACFAELREGREKSVDGEAPAPLPAEEPALILGRSIGLSLIAEIDSSTGFLVLYEESGRNDCVLLTASEERLIDQIVSLASAPGDLAPRTADMACDVLVGHSLVDVERRLVLRTLLHFGGDLKQSAFALGIDETELCLKVRSYFRSRENPSSQPMGGQ